MSITDPLSESLILLQFVLLGFSFFGPRSPVNFSFNRWEICVSVALPSIHINNQRFELRVPFSNQHIATLFIPDLNSFRYSWGRHRVCVRHHLPAWVFTVDNLFNWANRRIRDITSWFAESTGRLRRFVFDRIDDATTWWARNIDNLGHWVNNQIKDLTAWSARTWDRLQRNIQRVIRDMVQGWARTIDNLSWWVNDKIKDLTAWSARTWDRLQRNIQRVIREMVQGWARTIDNIADFIREKIGEVTTWWARNIEDLWQWANKRIKDLTTWWSRNIEDLAGWLRRKVCEFAPCQFFEDPINWIVNAFLAGLLDTLGDGIIWTMRQVMQAVAHVVLTPATKQMIRQRANKPNPFEEEE